MARQDMQAGIKRLLMAQIKTAKSITKAKPDQYGITRWDVITENDKKFVVSMGYQPTGTGIVVETKDGRTSKQVYGGDGASEMKEWENQLGARFHAIKEENSQESAAQDLAYLQKFLGLEVDKTIPATPANIQRIVFAQIKTAKSVTKDKTDEYGVTYWEVVTQNGKKLVVSMGYQPTGNGIVVETKSGMSKKQVYVADGASEMKGWENQLVARFHKIKEENSQESAAQDLAYLQKFLGLQND